MKVITIQDHNQLTPPSLNSHAASAPMLTTEGGLISSIDPNPNSLTYAQLWEIASFSGPDQISDLAIYQWLLPIDFAIRWLQQGGNDTPRIAWHASEELVTAPNATVMDLAEFPVENPELTFQKLKSENVEYVLMTPALVTEHSNLFTPFITTDGKTLTIHQLPPNWRLAYVYPDLNCQWCLFQLRPPEQSTPAIFDNAIALEGFDISDNEVSGGDTLHLTLHWHSMAEVVEPLTIFIHILDKNGQLVSQTDAPPMFGLWPTNTWQPGTQLADRHSLTLDKKLPAGTYTIAVGLYNPATLERLPVESEKNPVTDNVVILTEITIP